jgi:hypothetical protein
MNVNRIKSQSQDLYREPWRQYFNRKLLKYQNFLVIWFSVFQQHWYHASCIMHHALLHSIFISLSIVCSQSSTSLSLHFPFLFTSHCFTSCPGYSLYHTKLQSTSLRQPKMQLALILWTTYLFLSAGLSPHGIPSLSSEVCTSYFWLDVDRFIAGLRASNVGAVSEDLDKSIDSAFPAVALADDGLVVAGGRSGHLSESFTMLQCW